MDVTSKLSLYDFLTMEVMGFLVIIVLSFPLPAEPGSVTWVLLFVASYFVGIIYHRIIEMARDVVVLADTKGLTRVGGGSRIKQLRKCAGRKNSFSNNLFLFTIAALFYRNCPLCIIATRPSSYRELRSSSQVMEEYYSHYYSIMGDHCYSTVSVLEVQEAFLRDLTWIILFSLIGQHHNKFVQSLENGNVCVFNVCLVCVFILCLIVRIYTQMKIYTLVWNGGEKMIASR